VNLMRLWQRRTHPWIWLIVAAVVAFALVALVQDQPGLLNLR
jgi:ABC-type phosphate transport system auxiliary subunit